jgi:pimeloyl-ACP methyl ester carboxylesterase
MWAAARHKLKEGDELFVSNPLQVAGVIALAGIPDLQTAKDWNICETCPRDLMGGCLPFYLRLTALGSYDDFPERYRQGSPKHLAPLTVPQIFITGYQDSIVPLDYVQSYINYAQQLGEDISNWSFDRSGHFELVHPGSEAGSSVVRAVKELLLKPTTK